MKKEILLLCFLFLLFGCVQKKEKHIIYVKNTDFPLTESIYGEVILKKDYNKNLSIDVFDDILLIRPDYSSSIYYHAYDKNSLKYLGGIGVRGEGDKEWLTVYDSGQFEKSGSEIYLWLHRYQKGFLSKINISKTLKSGSPYPVIEKTLKVDSKDFPFFTLFTLNNEKLIGNCWMSEEGQVRIKSYNIATKVVKKSKLFPQIKNSSHLPSEVINSLYSSGFRKHPSKNLFMQSMYMFNRIDIFDENLTLKHSIVGGENWRDNYYDGTEINPASDFFKNRVNGYISSRVTKNYILVVDSNKKKSIIDNFVKESYIKIFNWEGQPICILKTSDNIFSISLDEEDGILYATDVVNEKILRYNIKKIMEKWKKLKRF